ncbi:hypothetical protein VU01_100312 [Candidatus Electrothrix marina]|uniref:Uncharacterized protein n=1 Tax=Candidatus Electrothrix marina TaxID=1859130 RepID=A0A444JHI0_9BACT|nr:hypothetical protein VU01_100312 [Candidatus Electrothrix marina]
MRSHPPLKRWAISIAPPGRGYSENSVPEGLPKIARCFNAGQESVLLYYSFSYPAASGKLSHETKFKERGRNNGNR